MLFPCFQPVLLAPWAPEQEATQEIMAQEQGGIVPWVWGFPEAWGERKRDERAPGPQGLGEKLAPGEDLSSQAAGQAELLQLVWTLALLLSIPREHLFWSHCSQDPLLHGTNLSLPFPFIAPLAGVQDVNLQKQRRALALEAWGPAEVPAPSSQRSLSRRKILRPVWPWEGLLRNAAGIPHSQTRLLLSQVAAGSSGATVRISICKGPSPAPLPTCPTEQRWRSSVLPETHPGHGVLQATCYSSSFLTFWLLSSSSFFLETIFNHPVQSGTLAASYQKQNTRNRNRTGLKSKESC